MSLTFNLIYQLYIVFDFDDKASFAACRIRGTFLRQDKNHVTINRAQISFNTDFSWHFNDEITALPEVINPTVSIKVNGSSESTTLTQGNNLSLMVELNPGANEGKQVDYWVWVKTPVGTYWLNNQLQFVRSNLPVRAFGGPLLDLSSFQILDSPVASLPSGSYEAFFAVDDNLDNIIDATFQDQVDFSID